MSNSSNWIGSASPRILTFRFVASVLALFLVTLYGHTQATSGTINGILTDNSGAVLASAPVVLTNTGTGDKRPTTTNGSGFYQFPNLPPGDYRITIQKPGFKQLTREPIDLQVDSTLQINLTLSVGSDTEKVFVSARTPLIQAETASLGQVIDQRQTNEIPLNGRNPMNLVALAPSVVPQGQSLQNPNGTNPFA